MGLKITMMILSTGKECILKEKEIKLLFAGLYYAYVRDSITTRKKDYKKLIGKLNKLTGRL